MLGDTAESATDETRDALHKSAMELESLGLRIEKRTVESVAEMDRVFARGRFRHWPGITTKRASNIRHNNQPTQAGHRLRRTAII